MPHRDAANAAPSILPLVFAAPRPILTLVSHSVNRGGWTTSVARRWAPGGATCQLCPADQCGVVDGLCLVTVQRHVAPEDAPGLSLVPDDDRPVDGPAAPLGPIGDERR